MILYILKRLLIFIPTIIIISLLTFIISLNAPGDPVELMLGNVGEGGDKGSDKLASEKTYLEARQKLGLDLPIFYCSLGSVADCDTLYKISRKQHQKTLARLSNDFGNWGSVSEYYTKVKQLENAIYNINKDSINENSLINLKNGVNDLYAKTNLAQITLTLNELVNINQATKDRYDSISDTTTKNIYKDTQQSLESVKVAIENTQKSFENLQKTATPYKKYVPVIHWYGLNNQYHTWFLNFWKGDFGKSYQSKRPISAELPEKLKWTIILSILSIFLTYIIAVPLGVYSAVKKGTTSDKFITTLLFILYSIPNFWIATLLIIYLGGGDYLNWFPPYGVGETSPDNTLIQNIGIRAHHLFLPLICWTYANFAYVSRQMRGGMLSTLLQDYIRTARAKGLPENKVVWKHAFRNSLLPIITLFAYIFPNIISGSVVLEVIFTIPGMGKWAFDAINYRDYPVIFTIMMFSTILTMVGYLVADILYAFVDPRISFGNKK